MKNKLILFTIAAATFAAGLSSALADFEGQISFSSEEQMIHQSSINTLLDAAVRCVNSDLEHHRQFYSQYGISPFYGDRSSFGKSTDNEKRAVLRRLHLPESLLNELRPTSCVGLALKCLGRGFAAAGQTEVWNRIRAYTSANDQDGTSLQDALQKLGWKILYWNPDTRQNEAWDYREHSKDPSNQLRMWGYHAYRLTTVRNSSMYYNNHVDDGFSLVDFGERQPSFLRQIPFFIGTAHAGYHVFPGSYGQVIEGHSTRALTDKRTLESSEFNPLRNGGGPAGQYKSGLMAVPPGFGF